MKKLFMLFFLISFVLQQAAAQRKSITGKITDATTGQPIPGVTVLIKGTSIGTSTDVDGSYKLEAPNESNVLVFSFIGYQTIEKEIGGASTINIALPVDSKQLDEVVVTALGIERTKNELPYAAQTVQGDQVTKTRDANFVNSLSGKVAGLSVKANNSLGGSSNVTIRGTKSIGNSNQALFVVDGVPIDNTNNNSANQQSGRGGYDYGNAAADVNPEDIASITVLKGAAATALYGSRAANGVIMITTKKGSKDKGIGVTLNTGANWGIIDKSTFISQQKQYGAGYGNYYGPNNNTYFNEADIDGDGTSDLLVPFTEDASFGAAFDPNLMVYQWGAFDPTSPTYMQKTPWVAAKNDVIEFFETPVGTANSLTFDATTEKGFFKLGYSRNSNTGILPNSKVTKDFINFSASNKLTDKITASASINYTYVEGLGRYGTGYNDNNMMTSFRQWWQTNVDILELKEAYERTGQNITWNRKSVTNATPMYWDNPYWTRYQNYENDSRDRYFGNVKLDYNVTDWLSIMGRVSLDSYTETQEERYAVGSLSPSSYSRFERKFKEYNYDLMANIKRDLTPDISFSATLGTNIRRTLINSIFAKTNGGLVIPGLYSLSNSVNAIEAPSEVSSELQVNGYFASTTFGYKNLAFVDLAYRIDQASSLPLINNTYPYGSVSGSFVFSELIGPVYGLTYGKLRANYAEVGNMPTPYNVNSIYTKPTAFAAEAGNVTLFSLPGTRNNENLKPERTKSFEIGMEMSFLDARTGFDATYYRTNSVDQILRTEVSRSSGYDYKYINGGSIVNKGVELSAFVKPVKTPDFSWTVNANWSTTESMVKDLAGIDNYQLGSFQGGVSINASVGEKYGTIRGTDYVYHENGQKVVGANGKYLTSAANTVIGNINPDWIGGLSNTFNYKGVALSFLIDVKKGGDVFSLDQAYGQASGVTKESTIINGLGNPVRNPLSQGGGILFEGVKVDGSSNDVRVSASSSGAFGLDGYPLSEFVYDAGFVKLREVTLSYALPEAVVSKLKFFEGIDFSLYGRNLWIIHKNLPAADPEESFGSGNLSSGYQGGTYPTAKTLGFNIRARF